MIKFFRKTRKKLADDNKFFKYSRYAIGEILLVVIGILIALSINNWNESRKDRIQEKEILSEISETIVRNNEILENHMLLIEDINRSNEVVILWIENESEYSEEYQKEFHRCFRSGSNIFLSSAGYDELKNSGLELIRNTFLKNEIIYLFGVDNLRRAQLINFFKQHFPIYEDFLIKNFITETQKLIPINREHLQKNSQFLGIVKRIKERRERIKDGLQSNLQQSRKVLQLIEDELAK
ncbi:MAG: hypothetical protein KAJ23_14535 [Maribacter sp.]|nr:hypothetical protein [Maribacter sp.]